MPPTTPLPLDAGRPDARPDRRRLAPAGIAAALLGAVLFWYAIRRAGAGEIADGIRRLGSGFLLVLLLSGVRDIVRTLAWRQCVQGERPFGLLQGLGARLGGEALGNLTPLGLLVSEPAKAILVKDQLPVRAGFSATIVENLFYSLSVAAVIAAGMVALLAAVPLSPALERLSLLALGGILVVGVGLLWLGAARPKLLTAGLQRLHRWGLVGRRLERQIVRIESLEEHIYGFYRRYPGRLVGLSLLDLTYHAAGVAEVYVILLFIAPGPEVTLLSAFILESVNRVITVVFKLVPLRLGVDEAASGIVSTALGIGGAIGVTLAVVRKARVLFWSAVGLGVVTYRGFSVRQVVGEAERVAGSEA